MKTLFSFVILFLAQLALCQEVFANFSNASLSDSKSTIVWDSAFYNTLVPEYQKRLNSFGDEVVAQLPALLVQSLQDRVIIIFKTLDKGENLVPPSCLDADRLSNLLQKKIAQEFDGRKVNENQEIEPSDPNPPVYGETLDPSHGSKKFRININIKFLTVILKGPSLADTYSCGHKNFYRLAQATLIHELSHVYDALNMTAINNPSERKLRLQCAATGPVPIQQTPVWCQDLVNQTKSISDRPVWKHLMNWNGGFFVSKTKNIFPLRSPDAYEKTNLSEAFAVNMEYFVLDSEFPCRRPEIDSFLKDHFKIANDSKPTCSSNTQVRYSNSQKPVKLDLSRLYEIHYLMAAKGQSVESRWGHSMFRLVFCSPKRSVPGPECLQDLDQHVVISYRANISGISQNYWNGLVGGYPSQMFVYTMPEIISEYTVSEFRDLLSIPLALMPVEKKRFLDRLLQEYWEYQGRYYFLGNNCATEAFDFLKGSVFRRDVQKKVTTIETPISLYNFLNSVQLLDSKVLNDPNREGRFFFSSHKKIIGKALQQVGQSQKIPDSIEAFAENFSAIGRRELYQKIAAKLDVTEQKKVAIQFYRLERAISYYFEEQRKRLVETVIANGDIYRENIRKILIARSRLSPWFLAKNGYGIPLENEMKTENELESDQKEVFEASRKIEESLQSDFPEMDDSIKEVNSNLLYFFNEIKRAVGGANPRP